MGVSRHHEGVPNVNGYERFHAMLRSETCDILPLIVTAGCEIPRDTPHENVLALCEPVPFVAN